MEKKKVQTQKLKTSITIVEGKKNKNKKQGPTIALLPKTAEKNDRQKLQHPISIPKPVEHNDIQKLKICTIKIIKKKTTERDQCRSEQSTKNHYLNKYIRSSAFPGARVAIRVHYTNRLAIDETEIHHLNCPSSCETTTKP